MSLLTEVVSRHGRENQPALRGQRPGSKANERIAWADPGAEAPLAGMDDKAMIGLDVIGFAFSFDEAEHAMLWQRLAGGPYGHINPRPHAAGGAARAAGDK